MSEIPYYFDTPVPSYFRKTGWFKNPKCLAFVSWAFSRCWKETHEIHHDGKKIILKPYQFIFGRRICSEETGLTEMEVRIQLNHMINEGYLKNATNRKTNRYSIYEWVTEAFCERNNQVNNQQTTNRQPTDNHKLDILETKDIKTTTSVEEVVVVVHNSEKQKASDEAALALKTWLDTQADVERRRKIGSHYDKITWGNDWKIPLKVFQTLIEKYGIKYVDQQIQYMFMYQRDFDSAKGKKGVDKPESFLRKSCEHDWALAKTLETK